MGFWTKFGIAVGGIAAVVLAIPRTVTVTSRKTRAMQPSDDDGHTREPA